MTAKIISNWKSTIAGVATITLGALQAMNGDSAGVALVMSGLGLIFTQDGA